ncbi:MAG: signal peptidase I [Helicobacteraceae bacterium 4484_230]|nr:MAG: signal peptidase I [Helicobacteraceae bacterium 4484_230]
MKFKVKILSSVLVSLFVLLTFVRIYKISDISMNYSLIDGDLVIVENFSAGVHIPSFFFYKKGHIFSNEKGICRGDIMAFKHPLDNRLYLKRVTALPGDRIFQENKNFFLQIGSDQNKTAAFAKEHNMKLAKKRGRLWLVNPYGRFYNTGHTDEVIGPKELINYPETVMPQHKYFFMGDFRDNSTDSRFFGPVEYDNIYYKVWFIISRSQNLQQMAGINQGL